MSSVLHRVDAGIPDNCLTCQEVIHFASYEGAKYTWHHVLTRDQDHEPIPSSLTLRDITRRAKEAGL